MSDYVQNYPALFSLMKQYAPQEAQMNIDLANQYAEPYGQALKTAQEAMYPEETAMNKQLMGQISEGMSAQPPDWYQNKYSDYYKSILGENALSGSGADYYSTGMMEQTKNWQDYYRNLGLSVTGKQPVYQAQPTQYTNQLSNYTPQTVFGYNSSNYGNYSNAYSNMYGANANVAAQGNPYFNAGAGIAGMGLGAMIMSSLRYKKNIRLWA